MSDKDIVAEARELLQAPLGLPEWAKRASALLTKLVSENESHVEGFCWVCRSRHRLIASDCPAMHGI